ncbi:MAG: hypothetical protein KGZ83_18150 [Sulfuricella sp.]|nr:hypothetical protein [Sulfuricella sp.]
MDRFGLRGTEAEAFVAPAAIDDLGQVFVPHHLFPGHSTGMLSESFFASS